MKSDVTLTRDQASRRYGPGFISHIMKDRDSITVSAAQDVALSEHYLMKLGALVPYRFPVIYVVETHGGCKVGQTFDIKRRVRAFDTGIPTRVLLRHIELLDGAPITACEKAVHAALSARHVAGEWFDVRSDEAIDEVRKQANRLGGSISLMDGWDRSARQEPVYRSAKFGDPHALRAMTDAREALRWAIDRLHSDMD